MTTDSHHEFADGYDSSLALNDLRRIASALADMTDDDNAQGDAADIETAAAWFAKLAEPITSNRQRLLRAIADIEAIAGDEAISPTPYAHLLTAASEATKAAQFVLDMDERDGITKVEL